MTGTSKLPGDRLFELSPIERARIGFELFELARRAARAGIMRAEPGLTETEVRQKIFLRFYERDLSPEQIAWAMERIALRVATEDAGRVEARG